MSAEESSNDQTVEVTAGPAKFKGPSRFLAGLVTGIFAGLIIAIGAIGLWEPARYFVQPIVATSVAAQLTARPTGTAAPTPTPRPQLRVIDPVTGNPINPEDGQYVLLPGRRVQLRVTGINGDNSLKWDAFPESENGLENDTGSAVMFQVPGANDQVTRIRFCLLDESGRSCVAEQTILILGTLKGN